MFPDERHDFFVSIATLRALRRVWAQLIRERYGGVTSPALALRTTVYGHGQETLREPINNIVRIGFGTLAYVLGGASFVYIASHDEAVGTPTEDTVKVAIRTQQIIAHEHGFTDTIDPLGGSYFVETLTKTIANQISEDLQKIEDIGGALRVIDSGFGHEILNRGAQRRQRNVDNGIRSWVTVNVMPQTEDVPDNAFRIDPGTTRAQHDRTARIRKERDNARVASALADVEKACITGENMVPPVMEAVRAYATIGEIADCWRRHFGLFEPVSTF
jgi:methylmalonyl-CoA mutase N-terminal domain/subunit